MNLSQVFIFLLMNSFLVDAYFGTSMFSLFFFFFLPGYLTLHSKNNKYNLTEYAVISILLSSILMIFFSQYLEYFNLGSSKIHFFIINIFYLLFIFLIKSHNYHSYEIDHKILLKNILIEKKVIIISILTFILPLLLYKNIQLHDYYMGIDPYRNIRATRVMDGSVNLMDNDNFDNPFYGFYYLIVAMNSTLNIDTHIVTKYFWIFNLAFILVLYMLTLHKSYKNVFVGIIPIIFLSNSFVMERFVMSIRENYSFTLLMCFIFFMNKCNEEKNYSKYLSVMALIYAGIFNSHPITFVFASFHLVYVLFYERFIAKNGQSLNIIKIFLGVFIAFPVILPLIKWYLWFVTWKIYTILGWGVPSHPGGLNTDAVNQAWTRQIGFSDFNFHSLVLTPIGFIAFLRKLRLKDLNSSFFLIPWTLLISILLVMTELGLYSSPIRLVIYLAFSLSFFSGILFTYLYDWLSTLRISIDVKYGVDKIIKQISIPSTFISVLCVMILFVPIMYNGVSEIDSFRKYSPFDGAQVQGAQIFISTLNSSNYTIITHPDDIELMPFVNAKQFIYNYTQIYDIFNSSTIDQLEAKLESYYGDSHIYLLISSRRFNGRQFPIYGLLTDDATLSSKYDGVSVYEFYR